MGFVVISKVKFPDILKDKIIAVGLEILPFAKKQKGFISIAFHVSDQEGETMMYWEWESKKAYECCMQSDDWFALMQRHKNLFDLEGVVFSSSTYNKLS